MTEYRADLHVDHRPHHEGDRTVSIYDRYGRAGEMQLTIEEARDLRDQLDEVLGDD